MYIRLLLFSLFFMSQIGTVSAQDLVIPIRAGWNNICANLEFDERYYTENSFNWFSVFEDHLNDIDIVKSEDGRFFMPRIPYCNLDEWDNFGVYHVTAYNEFELVIEGEPLAGDQELVIHVNRGIIPYLPNYCLPMDMAFSRLVEENVDFYAVNKNGVLYHPQYPTGPYPNLNPGECVRIYGLDDIVFSYPPEPDEIPDDELFETVHFQYTNTGVNMSIIIESLEGIQLVEGSEVACVTEAGLVAGASLINPEQERWGLAAWGDDSWTPDTIDGFEYDEPITFLYWDPVIDDEYQVEVELLEGHGITFRPSVDPVIVGMHVSVDDEYLIHPAGFSLDGVYPNPFNSSTQVSYTLNRPGQIRLSMYDLSGRLVYGSQFYYKNYGQHVSRVSGEGLQSGSYVITLDFDGERKSSRIVLLK